MLSLGSFAHSLVAPHEVAAALIGVLADLDADVSAGYRLRYRDILPTHKAEMNRLIAGLVRQLNRRCPPFTYCGHHIADTTNWGVWIDLGQLHRAEETGRLVQSASHPIKTRATFVLEIDGGVRLFRRKGWVQLWEAK